ncbi:hypothetical protein AB0M97_29255 [Streptomyces sp. NPDC051207]|uniref:hypothetical protein n=1 Tax=Streptomyces sp. NPDC051207 TaxID=3154641 RepID=UPI003427FE70
MAEQEPQAVHQPRRVSLALCEQPGPAGFDLRGLALGERGALGFESLRHSVRPPDARDHAQLGAAGLAGAQDAGLARLQVPEPVAVRVVGGRQVDRGARGFRRFEQAAFGRP